MRRWISIPTLFWLTLLGLVGYVAWMPTPQDETATAAQAAATIDLVNLLSNDDEAVEQAAVRQLVTRGPEVIPALEARAKEVRRYHRRMICSVLEEFLLSDDPAYSEPAEACLERLGQSEEFHIANDAYRILFRNSALRHARAASKFVRARGKLIDETGEFSHTSVPLAFFQESSSHDLHKIVVDAEWTGGDAGLIDILRLFPGRNVSLYVTADAPVSEAAVRQLVIDRRSLHARFPNAPCLGVDYDTNSAPGAVLIFRVMPETPAYRAGLRFHDRLVSLGPTPIKTLRDIEIALSRYAPGERVVLTIDRKFRGRLLIPVILGTDYTTVACACVAPKEQTPSPEPLPE